MPITNLPLPESRRPIVQLSVERTDQVCVVRILAAVWDKSEAEVHRQDLFAAVTDQAHVVFDLTAVRYIDHFAFELLLECIRRCPGRVACAGLDPAMESLFLLTQLATSIELYSNARTAVAAVTCPS